MNIKESITIKLDEEEVLEIVKNDLERQGYKVLSTNSIVKDINTNDDDRFAYSGEYAFLGYKFKVEKIETLKVEKNKRGQRY